MNTQILTRANDKTRADDPNFVSALARGLTVICAFEQDHERMTLSQIAKKTDLSRATARRFLLTLQSLGFIETNDKHFYLTPKILMLGYAYLTSTPLPKIIQPALERISQTLQESCSASVLEQNQIVYIARAATKRIMSVGLSVGSRLPAYCTSMGRVLLAGLTPEQLELYCQTLEPIAYTSHTLSDLPSIISAIEKTRQQGYAFVNQELEMGLCSIAVPIKNNQGQTIAAMNISAQAGRISETQMLKTFLPLLQSTARELIPQFGH